jgi:hypothetical protein
MHPAGRPDVYDKRVAVIADRIQRPSCTDVACIASEAAEGCLDEPRALRPASDMLTLA